MEFQGYRKRVLNIALAGLIGALYAALTIMLAPISYGALQFRVSEALCVLPFFFPGSVAGLTIGCAIANLLSSAGLTDVVFGSLATFIAALVICRLGKSYREDGEVPTLRTTLLVCAAPVLTNGPIIGAVLAAAFTPDAFWQGFWVIGTEVAIGEAGVMLLLGIPLMRLVRRIMETRSINDC